MKFFASAFTVTAIFAALASASNTLLTPKQGEAVKSGAPYLIKWEADTPGPVNIVLRKGDSKNLDTLYEIVMLEYNWGNYTWDVPADTENGKDYAFQIKWGKNPGPDDVNYTYLFEITDGKGDYESSTTESASATETEEATATETEYPTETETETATETETEPEHHTATKSADNSTETEAPSGSNTTSKPTKTPTGPTTTPDSKDEDNSAGVFGASVSMALAVAVAAAALL